MTTIVCECDDDTLPGVLWPMASDSDDSWPYVERCDLCERFDDDVDAAHALAAKLNGLVIWHMLYDDTERRRWQPAVHATKRNGMTIKEKATKIAWLINDEGHNPQVACDMVLEEDDDVFSEDSSCIDLDDPENTLVDFGWDRDEQGAVLYGLHRMFVKWEGPRAIYVWELRETRQLTNHAKDPDFEPVSR